MYFLKLDLVLLALGFISGFLLIYFTPLGKWSWQRWFNVFILVNILDIGTTYMGVVKHGWVLEANMAIQALGPYLGFLNTLLLLKLVLTSLIYFTIKKVFIEKANLSNKCLKYYVGAFSMTVVFVNCNNILVLVLL